MRALRSRLLVTLSIPLCILAVGCDQSMSTSSGPDGYDTRHAELAVDTSLLWPVDQIPVCWTDFSDSNATDRAMVQRAVEQTWGRFGGVTLTGWGECAPPPSLTVKCTLFPSPKCEPVKPSYDGIRIAVADVNPWSLLGTNAKSAQVSMTLNFAFSSWSPICSSAANRQVCIENIAVHEFGHALAFHHEQYHPDAGWHCENHQLDVDGVSTLDSPYDYESVMNYCNSGWSNMVSPGDVAALQQLYGKPEWTDYIDEGYYLARYADVAKSGLGAAEHYTKWGAKEGRDPNPFFDTSWYLSNNPDVKASGLNALYHFIKWGAKEGRRPHPLFDTTFYEKTYQVMPDPNPNWTQFVDQAHYFKLYPDVAKSGLTAAYHYGHWGWKEGRNPNSHFDTDWYLKAYPDVAKAKINPLYHYVNWGMGEGRKASNAISAELFFHLYPQLVPDLRLTAFDHFLFHGSHMGYQTSASSKWRLGVSRRVFDPAYYLATYPDVAASPTYGDKPLRHFLNHGVKEGRRPSRDFDPSAYLAANPDVAAAVAKGKLPHAFYHWIVFGIGEGRPGA